MTKVLVIQHIACETPGTISRALELCGATMEYVRPFEGQGVPLGLGDSRALVVMGGPMGVYEADRYPYLRDEMRLIERALREEIPILGVCLGSQLLASCLGARVYASGQKEIGWFPIDLSEEGRRDALLEGLNASFPVLHWHGDTFDLPQDATLLASSERTRHQAFRYGPNAYGFQFHLETTGTILRDMLGTFTAELQAENLDAAGIERDGVSLGNSMEESAMLVFGRFAGLMQRSTCP